MDKIIIFILFNVVLFYILGIFSYFLSKILFKKSKIITIIFSNFPSLIKKLSSICVILIIVSMLIIWVSIYMLPIKNIYITIPLNYLSAILIAISISSIEVIFFILGFISFGKRYLFKERESFSDKTINKFIVILLSIAMLLSVFVDYFASIGLLNIQT